MKYRIGDRVEVLDEPISGKVVSIEGDSVSIETEDGFLMEFSADGLIPTINEKFIKNRDLFKNYQAKDLPKRKKKTKQSSNKTVLEVDLHIHKLLPTSKGLTKHDILNYQIDTARKQLEFAISKKITKLVFIHGVGEGVLKMELNSLINRYSGIEHYDASYGKYGLGATELRISPNANRI